MAADWVFGGHSLKMALGKLRLIFVFATRFEQTDKGKANGSSRADGYGGAFFYKFARIVGDLIHVLCIHLGGEFINGFGGGASIISILRAKIFVDFDGGIIDNLADCSGCFNSLSFCGGRGGAQFIARLIFDGRGFIGHGGFRLLCGRF